MNIQKPGKAVGLWRTPLNVSIMLNSNVAILPAVSASGMAAMIMWANVLVNSMNSMTKSSMIPRVSLLWFFPNIAKYQEIHMRTARTTW